MPVSYTHLDVYKRQGIHMNRINWKVRIKNPVFWVQAAIAVVLPILTYFGLTWEDVYKRQV